MQTKSQPDPLLEGCYGLEDLKFCRRGFNRSMKGPCRRCSENKNHPYPLTVWLLANWIVP